MRSSTVSACHLARKAVVAAAGLLAALALLAAVSPGAAWAQNLSGGPWGELDCNGNSPVQQSVRLSMNCTDIRGSNRINNQYTWGGRFYDNGVYIGHDEPDLTFLSSVPGSGNNVKWTETLPRDPTAAPTATNPGSDVSHTFELSVAPWFSMDICDPNSYPQLACTPQSDANAPQCNPLGPSGCPGGAYPGGGAAFMEMQFYPPGFAPFVDGISCDNTHWCSALNIDSLECTLGFASCNTHCEEPINFAYIQTNGVPTGPPSPQQADLATFTPNAHTLLMNPGDKITVHMSDAPVAGKPGESALEIVVQDLTTGQTGSMQASAQNGFQNTQISDCSGAPFNFQPEYNTAAKANIAPWTALQTDISTQFETGHWVPCTSLTAPFTFTPAAGAPQDISYKHCNGRYEKTTASDGGGNPEQWDAFCYPKGDTHGGLATAPDTTTGCIDNVTQNGDLDFDGSPYWTEWPTGPTPTAIYPGSFVQELPASAGSQYSRFFIQTDLALSESTCSGTTTSGCAVPPPNAPGNFYPYWSRVTSASGNTCRWEFGNVSSGAGVNDFGRDAQYGTDRVATLGYSEFEGPVQPNTCT